MALPLIAEAPPIREDAQGAIRIGNTRVLLETVIAAYHNGRTAEQIAESFPSLLLAEVYLVIGYYLQHQTEVDVYLQRVEETGEKLRQAMETNFPADGIRERLLARRNATSSERK